MPHCGFLLHVSQLNLLIHMLKSRFVKFMVANLVEKNKYVAYVGNHCFRNAMSSSGRNINKIMSEYKFDYRLLQLPHVFILILCIWILKIVDCLNELCEKDFTYYDENIYLLSDICIT